MSGIIPARVNFYLVTDRVQLKACLIAAFVAEDNYAGDVRSMPIYVFVVVRIVVLHVVFQKIVLTYAGIDHHDLHVGMSLIIEERAKEKENYCQKVVGDQEPFNEFPNVYSHDVRITRSTKKGQSGSRIHNPFELGVSLRYESWYRICRLRLDMGRIQGLLTLVGWSP